MRYDERRSWVLVTDEGRAQARGSLAAARALGAAGYRVTVAAAAGSLAAASRYCARRVHVGSADDPAFAAAVRAETSARRYVAVLPGSDAALVALEVPVRHLLDKEELGRSAERAGFRVPETRRFESSDDLLASVSKLSFPLVVKASTKKGHSQPAYRAESAADVKMAAEPVVVQPYLRGPLTALAGVVWKGRLVAAVHQRYLRTWPTDCGTASAAETVAPNRDVEERAMRLLDGYDGIFQLQLVDGHLADVNPRVYGSLPLAVASGANLPAIYCDLLDGRELRPIRGRPGVFYRWLEGDVRNVLAGFRRERDLRAAVSALRPRPGAAHSTESLRDPRPIFVRLGHSVRAAGSGAH